MKNNNLFWGILLLTIGVLYLFKSLGIIWFNWFSILRLWPLLFILWGIFLQPLKGAIKFIFSIVVIDLAAGSYLLKGKIDSLAVINTICNTLRYNFSERDYKNKKILKLPVKDKNFKKNKLYFFQIKFI